MKENETTRHDNVKRTWTQKIGTFGGRGDKLATSVRSKLVATGFSVSSDAQRILRSKHLWRGTVSRFPKIIPGVFEGDQISDRELSTADLWLTRKRKRR